MKPLMLVNRILYISIVLILWLSYAESSFLSLWEQTCKVHTDNNHAELKDLIKQQDKFNINSWMHTGLMIIIGMLSLFMLIGCCCMSIKLFPVFLWSNKSRLMRCVSHYQKEQRHDTPPLNQHKYSGRKIYLQELSPTTLESISIGG